MVANKVGRYWLTRLENHAQHQHVRFVPPSEHELRAEYELIWIFQGYVSEQLNFALQKQEFCCRKYSITSQNVVSI